MNVFLDPGQTTGVAWRSDDGSLRMLEVHGDDIEMVLNGLHTTFGLELVVVENFRSRPGPAVNLSASETIGRVAGWCDHHGVPMRRQEPSAAKRVINDDTLRALGGWARGQNHARDAARHLFLYEKTHQPRGDLPS